ncbi:hypothetical protein BJF89_13645 [Corynebacterium sp. CNJ-954]|uniref:site-specific integrase n=1 Tax=Corynebacterium sp. CNJ-954 TaxID=1904962 RepID=UPI000959B2D1|nr:site-specific integrase [Corynebacterium sp. CNJ-954]OLT55825.1 hypothetical protein BJF89_13645 [Corynebacterium sp. CNJ-954]
MPTPQKYQSAKGTRWRIQYVDPTRTRRTRSGFQTKKQAEHWAAENLIERNTGSWIDPKSGKITVGQLGDEWLKNQTHLKASTRELTDMRWRVHVKPRWGEVSVNEVTNADVQAWVSRMERGASTVIGVHAILANILDMAVKQQRLLVNPARDVTLPKKGKGVKVYLTADQVKDLVDECSVKGDLIYLLATVGLRWGEAAALRVKDVDFKRRRISITRNAVTVKQKIVIGTTKAGENRTVAVPAEVLNDLKDRVKGKSPDDLLWHRNNGEPLLKLTGNSFFHHAVKRRMAADPTFPKLSPHGLRHVAAGLMVSSGANVKVVQKQLGHASATETLNRYADLFDEDLDAVADRMDDVLSRVTKLRASNMRKIEKEATLGDSRNSL